MNKSSLFATCAALLLAAGALLVLAGQPAEAQRSGPYQLVAHSNETADVGIFRLNVSSGAVSFCYVRGVTPTLACTSEVQ